MARYGLTIDSPEFLINSLKLPVEIELILNITSNSLYHKIKREILLGILIKLAPKNINIIEDKLVFALNIIGVFMIADLNDYRVYVHFRQLTGLNGVKGLELIPLHKALMDMKIDIYEQLI